MPARLISVAAHLLRRPLDSLSPLRHAQVLDLTFGVPTAADFAGFGEVLEQTAQTVRLKVTRAKVIETCRELLATCKVTDISVQEPPVEEVIRQLFGEHAEAREEATLSSGAARP